MATNTTLKAFAGSFRSRLQMMLELSEVYKREAFRRRDKLSELIKDINAGNCRYACLEKDATGEQAGRASKSELAAKMRVAKGFYTLEMAPPLQSGEMKKLAEDLKMLKDFFKTGCHKFLTVKQAWLLILVGLEIGLWFFLGETIGKFHIVGYKV